MPSFERVWRDRRGDGLVILGLSTDRIGADAVREFVRDRGYTYPIAMAPITMTRDFGGARVLPSSFLIDRAGRIRHEVTGYFAEPALRAALNRLLDE
jgi:peroxiredoxin